jgi:hypothetical protein
MRMWRPKLSLPRGRAPRRGLWILAAIGVVVALVYAAAFMLDEPLRRSVEQRMNARLKGYTVYLGGASLHPHGLSVDLHDVTVVQDANPDPPVLRIHRLAASVQWRALLRARLVANMVLDRPVLYVNLAHLKQEAREEVPVRDRGWQDALQEAYPLKINQFRVTGGEITYVDPAKPFAPLRLTELEAVAENIRNVRSAEREYPSELRLSTVVFDEGRLAFDGRADFLADPHPAVAGRVSLEGMELDYFAPIGRRYNARIDGGVLSAAGEFEYAPTYRSVVLERVIVQGAHVEYTHTPGSARTERRTAAAAARTGKRVTNRPDVDLAVRRLELRGITVGYVNQTRRPPYRVFVSDADLTLTGLTNKSGEAPARAEMRGKFMGSGATEAALAFRPHQKGGNLDLKVSIENTDMAAMNSLLRSYGKIEVAGGDFSLYSEIEVANGAIQGYVKPLFKNIEMASADTREDKSFGQKLKEKLVEGAAKLLKNRPRREVATVADISGRLDDPDTSVVQIVAKLIQNAFFKAILPGFDRESGVASDGAPRPARSRSGASG